MSGGPARHGRFIVVNEGRHAQTGSRILCAWEDCPRDGLSLYVVRVDYGRPGSPHVVRYAFCCERHQAYWAHAHRDNGNLPPGLRSLPAPR